MKDNFGRQITYMRLSVTDLCNLRCRYCMPEDGICKKRHEEILTEEEIILAVQAAAALGVTKLRITGGEPLVRRNILSICQHAAAVEGIQEVCLTTNGILLPELAKPLRAAGVSRVNLSLDTLDAAKYAHITRRGTLDAAMAGLETALSAGFDKVKINSVLIGGFNDDEIISLAELTKKYPIDVRFIELMPMYDNKDFDEKSYIPCSVVLDKLPEAVLQEPTKDHGVAKLYRLPGAQGNIGLISPVSAHFCGQCNRIRLTADGKLKPCLHSSDEYSIKGMNFEEMKAQMEKAILAKPAFHAELSASSTSNAGHTMNRIGG